MHILFIHNLFPAQFGQVARHLVRDYGFTCTHICERLPDHAQGGGPIRYLSDFAAGVQLGTQAPAGGQPVFEFTAFGPSTSTPPPPDVEMIDGIQVLKYEPAVQDSGGFDGQIQRAHAVFQALKSHPEIQPDLVVGPCIYASSLFLPYLYSCPVINYLDYFYRDADSYLTFRPDFLPEVLDVIRARAHNALVLYDLEQCAAAYSPTQWQRSLFPERFQSKIATIFDGIDRTVWRRRQTTRQIPGRPALPPGMKVVTYVARGLEAMRGFDIFMRVAQQICRARSDVMFVVVGSENFYHGADLKYIRARSFLEHVLSQDNYDLSRFLFVGRVPSEWLADILSMSDLHVYLTAPFVLSWSLFDALACACTVLASDTAPVREVITHEQNGLLADFFDVDGLTRQALQVLDEPEKYRPLAEAGARTIDERYSLERTMPTIAEFLRTSASRKNS